MNIKNKNWMGAGVVALGLSLPFVAQAHSDDEAMAFVVGAAVGYAIGDGGDRHHHAHYRSARGLDHDRYWKAHARAHKRWRDSRRGYGHSKHGQWDDYGYHDRRHDGGYGVRRRG